MSLVENREISSVNETREDDDSLSSSPILVTRAEASRATLQTTNGDSMEYEPATDFYHRRTGLQGISGVGTINATHIVRYVKQIYFVRTLWYFCVLIIIIFVICNYKFYVL